MNSTYTAYNKVDANLSSAAHCAELATTCVSLILKYLSDAITADDKTGNEVAMDYLTKITHSGLVIEQAAKALRQPTVDHLPPMKWATEEQVAFSNNQNQQEENHGQEA